LDRTFTGSATAAEALRRSLNMPAVALPEHVGPSRFAASLAAAGVKLRLPPGADPSLPLALGGAGIDLCRVTGLYAAISPPTASVRRCDFGLADKLMKAA
jgi:penicillin-binding protein 1C